ncbi:hypothetical protein PVT67_17725 [Gallaecimonas kandeliae]|uniref:hypothetical protein n=1 Tax=Gallaecimonas kandeliae TaxID=3029055 RepID=UPI0026471618|nr:hypothetical protein [Gallaecimonas kandeliae]WKE65483.1 hypothetical protein PVT67_17725 [Gallaecimonas kandeliae]
MTRPFLFLLMLWPGSQALACTLSPVQLHFSGPDIASIQYQQGLRKDSEEPFIRAIVLYKDADMAVVESRNCEMENYSVNYFSTSGKVDNSRLEPLLAPSPLHGIKLAKPLLGQLPTSPGIKDLSDDVSFAKGQVELLVSRQSLEDALTPYASLVSISLALGGAD